MSEDYKCSICSQREVEVVFTAETWTRGLIREQKRIAPVEMCQQCADRTMENVCFIIDQPNDQIV
mgnify:CR=1 FL=1|jgi:hypothetical protein